MTVYLVSAPEAAAIRTVNSRLSRLEDRFAPAAGQQIVVSLCVEIDADIAEDFNLGGRGHRSLLKESGASIRGR